MNSEKIYKEIEMFVIKRDGRQEGLNIEKIRRVIERATRGLEVSVLKLETAISDFVIENITTRDIQQNLIYKANSYISLEEPDWRYVAGRLLMMDYYKETCNERGYGYAPSVKFKDYLENRVAEGTYTKEVLKGYTDEGIEELGEYIREERDDVYDYAGASLLLKRYLAPKELAQEAYMVIAMLLAKGNKELAKAIYDAVSLRKISLATPILSNLRRNHGSTASCFVQVIDDSLESIFDAVKDVAKISAASGGVGINLSRIRAAGAPLREKNNSTNGVIPWIKIFNDTAVAVDQGGTRAGAVTVALDTWHKDIEDFLELQTEAGDQRKKSYDVFPQVVVSDLFMSRVENQEQWTIVDPYEVRKKLGVELAELWGEEFEKVYAQIETSSDFKTKKQVSARNLFKKILKTLVETGLPYVCFKDQLNRYNPNNHIGNIYSFNLCQESTSVTIPDKYTHVCSLCSLNLANLEDSELENVCNLAVKILDNTIDISKPSIPEAVAHNESFRVIGVGAMGLADYLAKQDLKYGEESLTVVNSLFEKIAYYSLKASIKIAGSTRPFKEYQGSTWSKGLIYSKPLEWYKQNGRLDWESLHKALLKYGVRNSQILAIAPNSSSALLQGCTGSVLPPYAHLYKDKNGMGKMTICPQYVKEKLWYYPQNKYLKQTTVIKVVATIQKWIDTGISMDLLYNFDLPEPPTAKDIYEDYLLAWKLGLKSIYYIRPNPKTSSNTVEPLNPNKLKTECTSCAN